MNLHSRSNNVAGGKKSAAVTGFFRQIREGGLLSIPHSMKSLSVRAGSVAACLVWVLVFVLALSARAQTNYYSANGTDYPIVGSLPGDQVFPDAAVSSTGGIVVWQDNATDGDGWGISARRLDSTLSGTLGTFRVNVIGAGDQEHARVALLKNGGAVFVWQGGTEGYQHIFARFLTPTNTFLSTTDLPVSTFSNSTSFQVNPAVAALNNGNVVVVWSSFNQASSNSLLDVYAKILSPTGTTISNEFLVNQFTNYNQRSPAVAALAGGGFAVAWVSEQERTGSPNNIDETNGTAPTQFTIPSVDIYARLYQSNGVPAGQEFFVNTATSPCANPSIAAASDGGFMIAWSQRNMAIISNGWDVFARAFSSASAGGTPVQLNTYVYGNQYAPRLSAIGLDYLAVWTSMGQDGSREGVYGQFVHNDGSLVGNEFRVNTTTVGQQMQPAIASDGADQFLVVWTSFTGSYNFDLFAQRYVNVAALLQPMSAPCVWAPFVISNGAYQPQLVVTWAPLLGLSVSNYEVYVDGNTPAVGIVSSNTWTMTAANGLTKNSTHTFAVDYVTTSGHKSPLSPSASGTTWGGNYWGGIPSEWMTEYYGADESQWPPASTKLGPNMTIYQVFLSGGSPLDPSTWLTQQLVKTGQGMFLTWNTQPGATYQVQATTNFGTWINLGSARFAAGTTDSINVGSSPSGYYRVVLLRQ